MSGKLVLVSLLTQGATAAALVVAIAAWDWNTGWRIAFIVATLALLVVSVALTVVEYRAQQAKKYPTNGRINRFMYDWIQERGKTVIFSNDMSWVSDDVYVNPVKAKWEQLRGTERPTIKDLLTEKARSGELVLCLPRPTELSRELEGVGAKVTTYEALDLVPSSRFTIVRFGQQGAAVAIGHRDSENVHRIETFADGQHPTFALTSDLVRFVSRYCEVHG